MSGDPTSVYLTLCCSGSLLTAFGIVGVLLLVRYRRQLDEAHAAHAWPKASGQVTVSTVKELSTTWADGESTSEYYADIRYTYQVNGQIQTGKDVAVGGQSPSLVIGPCNALAARYPVGKAVSVYYNPQNPSEAVLEKHSSGATTSLVIGIIMFLLAACFACAMVSTVIGNYFDL
jgi:hypothetical protein